MKPQQAPELQTSQWFNTDTPISLKALRGRVVLIEAFQMLCPGCVSHGLPQAARVAKTFGRDKVTVIGLHTVFEHHDVTGPSALKAFLHEYRIDFPVGVDLASGTGGAPKTMTAYRMQGTPTLILVDALGNLRKQAFGAVEDLALGAEIMALIDEREATLTPNKGTQVAGCDDNGCTP